MIVEKKISDLSIGLYILDIVKQEGTYCLKNPGHVKSVNVLSHLATNGVISVLVDESKTLSTSTDKDGNTVLQPLSPQHNKDTTIKLELTKAKKYLMNRKVFKKKCFQMHSTAKILI